MRERAYRTPPLSKAERRGEVPREVWRKRVGADKDSVLALVPPARRVRRSGVDSVRRFDIACVLSRIIWVRIAVGW